jgi:cell division protein FtsB
MHEKIKAYRERLHTYTEQLSDLRVIGLLVFLSIALLISWSGIKVIDTNYGLQQQIAQLQQQNAIQQLTNSNLALQNEYYNTNQYLDVEARQDFGLAAPGETALIVPLSVALAHTVNLPNSQQQQAVKTNTKQPAYQRNFQAWMDFFLHRETSQD